MRLRLVFLGLAVLALAPFVVKEAVHIHDDYRETVRDMEARTAAEIERARQTFLEIRADTERLLANLAEVPAVRTASPETCSGVIERFSEREPAVENLVLADPTGTVYCGDASAAFGLRLGDRPYFRSVVTTGETAWSDIIVNRLTREPAMVAAAPLFRAGAVRSVAIATIDLSHLSAEIADFVHNSDAAVYIVSAQGFVSVAYPSDPEAISHPVLGSLEVARRILGLEQGLIGIDTYGNGDHILGVVQLPGTSTRLVISHHAETAVAAANADMMGSLLTLLLGAALVIGAATMLTEYVLLRSLRKLTEAAARVDRGDLSARASIHSPLPEMNQLAVTFNAMVGQLEALAMNDGLTNLPNRRRLDRHLAEQARRNARHGTGYALALVDVDHFKMFNDRYGHPAGDACLRTIAASLRGFAQRPDDLAARYGGEEFALVLGQTDPAGVAGHLERLRQAVFDLAVPHGAPGHPVVTVSIGFAIARPGETVTDLVARADEALYRAKRTGRDKVVAAASAPPSDVSEPLRLRAV